jgi:hypothetical protein
MKRTHIFSAAAFAAVIFLYPLFINAQQTAPDIQWEKSLGGSDDDEAMGTQQTYDGGYIVAGYTKSTDGDITINHGGYDFFIVKLDATGSIQWKKTLGGTGDDYAYAIRQTNDSGYIVVGSSNSNDGDVTGNHGDYDFWVVKLDSAGNITWEKSFGGTGRDEATAVQQTTDSGYIVAGISWSNNGDVTGNHGMDDMWVIKLDANGNMQWEKSYGGGTDDAARSIEQTAEGGFIIGGFTNSKNGDAVGARGFWEYWIVKVDVVGNIQWQKSYGGQTADTDDSFLHCIRQTTDGGYIISGESSGVDGDVTGNHGNFDFWILKLDGAGNIQWKKCCGGSSTDGTNYSCIQQTNDSGYVFAGGAGSDDGDVTGNHGGFDVWVVKIDGNGNIQWKKCYGGKHGDVATWIQQTRDGEYIIAGGSYSYDDDVTGHHGDTIPSQAGLMDYWIVKLGHQAIISSLQNDTLPIIECETSEFDTLYIHNTGISTLVINSAGYGNNPSYSLVAPASFPVSIAAGDSLRYIVKFEPSIIGSIAATLNIVSNDSIVGHNPWQINFTGIKDSIDALVSGIANDTLDFGAIPPNTTKDSAFVLVNASTIPTTFSFQSEDTLLFKLKVSLFAALNSQNTIAVHFSGETVPGRYIDSLIITDTCGRTQTVYLAVTVKSGIPSGIQITDPIDAGYVHINTQKTVPFTIRNTGTAGLTINTMTLKGTNAQYYQLKNVPQLPFTIAAGNTQTMDVTFSPVNAGTQDATLEITTSLSSSALDIPVDGIGTRSVLTANALNFDTVNVSTCKTDTMKVTNAGNYPLLISQIGILGVYAGDYTVLTTVKDTLHPGDTADIAIKYCPTASGEEDVIAELITSDGDTLFVNIYGGGASAVQEILPSSTTLSQNYPNPFSTSTNIEVRIPNAGAATLKVYNVLGVEVADLTQELRRNNDVTFTANGLQAGVYFYTLETATRQITRQMFVVR